MMDVLTTNQTSVICPKLFDVNEVVSCCLTYNSGEEASFVVLF